jgi:hypothetical protein
LQWALIVRAGFKRQLFWFDANIRSALNANGNYQDLRDSKNRELTDITEMKAVYREFRRRI